MTLTDTEAVFTEVYQKLNSAVHMNMRTIKLVHVGSKKLHGGYEWIVFVPMEHSDHSGSSFTLGGESSTGIIRSIDDGPPVTLGSKDICYNLGVADKNNLARQPLRGSVLEDRIEYYAYHEPKSGGFLTRRSGTVSTHPYFCLEDTLLIADAP